VSISFTVYPSARLVNYTVEGNPTDDQVREFLDAVMTHRWFRRGFDFLGNSCVEGASDAAYPQALAQEVRARRDRLAPCRWAVLASSPGAVVTVRMRGALTLTDGVKVAAFLTPEEAADWLGAAPAPRPAPSARA
jgi:hypothetical protein